MTPALAAAIAVIAAGVLVPKVAPAVLPLGTLPGWLRSRLEALGPATMGALAAATALSGPTLQARLDTAAPAALAALLAAVTRRPLLAMAGGFGCALLLAWK